MWVAGDEAGTVGYSPWWWALAVVLLVLVLAWNVGVLLWARPHRAHTSARPASPSPSHYLARIDRIQADNAAGTMSHREAHQQVSALVRRYVQEHTDVAASAMTLQDLRDHGLDDLAGLVETAYPPSFEPSSGDPDDLEPVVAAARRIVGGSAWA